MVEVCREIRRVLRSDGTFWMNLGDSYSAHAGQRKETDKAGIKQQSNVASTSAPSRCEPTLKPKDLMMVPARLAIRLQEDGWVLRSNIRWCKKAPMPESCEDRPTSAVEDVFLFSRAEWRGTEKPLPLRREDAAWLAALIDGEGTICFQERADATGCAPSVSIRLSVVNTHRGLLERVREIVGYGGSDTPSPRWRNDGSSGRPVFTWQVGNAKAARVIAAIRPYLIAKGTQADLALKCHELNQKHRGRRVPTTSAAELAFKRRLSAACSALNHGEDVDLSWFKPARLGRWVPLPYSYDAEAVKEDGGELGNRNAFRGFGDYTTQGGGAFDNSKPRNGNQIAGNDGVRSKRNMRNYMLLGPSPFPGAHFATFHPEIPTIAILSGTSEKGVCPKCGAPWTRVITKEESDWQGRLAKGAPMRSGLASAAASPTYGNFKDRSAETIGWRATCRCDAGEPVPATVLDPFAGAFTTCLVSERLQRNSIGIELNPTYCEMGRKRLAEDASLFFAETPAEPRGEDEPPRQAMLL
jgi:hypothetical protein